MAKRPERVSDIRKYSCPFGKDLKDDRFLNDHPGGYNNLLSAYEVEEGAAKMLFLSYHIGHNISSSYRNGKLLGYTSLPIQTDKHKELDDIYCKIINKYWFHQYIYKLWCIIDTLLMYILRIYFILHPTILKSVILTFLTLSYGGCILHTRAHCGNHFIFNKKYKYMNKIINVLFNTIECIIFLYPQKTWIQIHNKSHHLYTNTTEDYDLWKAYPMIKYHKHYKNKKYHKYQYIYVVLLFLIYGLLSFHRIIINKITNKAIPGYYKSYFYTFLHFSLFYILPYYLHGIYPIFLTLSAKSIGGLIVIYLFHGAHINENIKFFKWNKNTNNLFFQTFDIWIKNQIETSLSWSPNSYFLSLFFGALNCHIEHHIAPSIIPIYYCFVTNHIQRWCKKHNIIYHKKNNWFQMIHGYHKQLYNLGNKSIF